MSTHSSVPKSPIYRPISSYNKVQVAIGAIIRNRLFFANLKEKGCYLDIGCGPNIKGDFCHLDYDWRPGLDVCWDITRGLPFPSNYIGGIFTEHALEHISFFDALRVLSECRRIMANEAVLRIVVPDGELYLAEYAKHLAGEGSRMPYEESDSVTFPFVTPLISINRIFRDHGHLFIWDYETLRLALLDAGFTDVSKRAFGEGSDDKLLRDSRDRKIESLYVEARR